MESGFVCLSFRCICGWTIIAASHFQIFSLIFTFQLSTVYCLNYSCCLPSHCILWQTVIKYLIWLNTMTDIQYILKDRTGYGWIYYYIINWKNTQIQHLNVTKWSPNHLSNTVKFNKNQLEAPELSCHTSAFLIVKAGRDTFFKWRKWHELVNCW